jgi:hypothetical protein
MRSNQKAPDDVNLRERILRSSYYLAVNAMTKPMQVREDSPPYGTAAYRQLQRHA